MNVADESSLLQREVSRRSFFRLRSQRSKIDRLADGDRKRVDLERWQHAVAEAKAQFAARCSLPTQWTYDPELPIYGYRERIIELLRHRQVMVLCGETGSGKSTQLPKLCIEAGFGRHGWIGHTQPRRLAARSIAHRLADELGSRVGQAVGYKVRFNDQTAPTSLIKLMTDGVLLAEIQRDRFLDAYDCIIVDEAHERSLNIDLLMAYLCDLVSKRDDLRVIITSATIDADRYAEHFRDAIGTAPIIAVEGRSFPVDVRYRGAQWASSDRSDKQKDAPEYDDTVEQRFCDAVDELFREGNGDILAFFPTERDIRDAAKQLRGHLTRCGMLQSVDVLPLYARLTEAEQQRVFQPHQRRRIVLATNVAESSLTVPGIRYVIDTGTARVSRFAAKSRVQRLPIEPISQASANQRSGRCGRVAPGIAIRLFDEQDYLGRPAFAPPEIRRSDLASIIVSTKSLGIHDLESLAWLDPPRPESVREGLHVLRELRAIDASEQLTDIGRKLARWPIGPRSGRILIEADRNGCLADALIIAAALETQDPRVRPPEAQQAADEAHQRFRDPNSDFLCFLRIWDFYTHLREQLGRSRLEKACRENFLSLVRMREWADVHRQLVEQCREMKMNVGARTMVFDDAIIPAMQSSRLQREQPQAREVRYPAGYEALHMALLAGLLSGVAILEDTGKYRGAGNLELMLWPGSGMKQSKAKWIVAAEVIETNLRYARTIARVDPEWIELLGEHMIQFTYDEPHFSCKHGAARTMRRGTLFGLPVSPKVSIPLAPIDPVLARKLLIEHGLGEGELVSRARFWKHNQAFLDEVKRWGDKTRRRDLVVDPFVLIDFYRKRIPVHVVDRVTLESWDRTIAPPTVRQVDVDSTQTPYLTWEDLTVDLNADQIERDFPSKLDLGVSQFPLSYRFEPGDQADGVSLRVPQSTVHQLHAEKLEWLVPGLLEEKLTYLLKSLPKRLRRQLVPVPDTVKKLAPELVQHCRNQAPFWKSLCETLSRWLGEGVTTSDFDIANLPEHLRFRIELLDEAGQTISASRTLADIQATSLQTAALTQEPDTTAEIYYWKREEMQTWDIVELPRSVIEVRGGVRVSLFPTLVLQSDAIHTGLIDHEGLAEQSLKVCMVKLLSRIERREIRSQLQFLPNWNNAALWLSGRFTSDRLREEMTDLIARLAFLETDWNAPLGGKHSPIRTQEDFELCRLKRIEKIAGAAAEVGRWLPKVADAYHRARSVLEKSPGTWRTSLDTMRQQLEALFSEPWGVSTPWYYLRELPRYLQGIGVRLERLKSIGPSKDSINDQTVIRYWGDYQRRLQAIQLPAHHVTLKATGMERIEPTGPLQEYRWLIEELRISIHAQQLGMRVSISPKRLDKLIEQLG